jgi:hypothetical protein
MSTGRKTARHANPALAIEPRKVSKALLVGALVTGTWVLVYPHPFTLALGVAAIIPWLALWLLWRFPDSFEADVAGRPTAKADLLGALVMPGVILCFRAWFNEDLTDPTQPIWPAVAGAMFTAACLWFSSASLRERPQYWAIAALMLALYPAALIPIVNQGFDQSEPRVSHLQVVSTRYTTGKGASQYFTLADWSPDSRTREVRVSSALFQRTAPGQMVCVFRHPGALKMEWYSLGPAIDC